MFTTLTILVGALLASTSCSCGPPHVPTTPPSSSPTSVTGTPENGGQIPSTSVQGRSQLIDLGALLPKGGVTEDVMVEMKSYVTDMDGEGGVAGYYEVWTTQKSGFSVQRPKGFVYRNGTMTQPEGMAKVTAIGGVAGGSLSVGENPESKPVLLRNGQLTQINVGKTPKARINGVYTTGAGNPMLLVGQDTEKRVAFVATDDGSDPAPLFPPVTSFGGRPILSGNASSDIGASAGLPSGLLIALNIRVDTEDGDGSIKSLRPEDHVVVVTLGGTDAPKFKDIGNLPGKECVVAKAMNAAGWVAGEYQERRSEGKTRGFVYRSGVLEDIGTLGGAQTWPKAMNRAGDIVGVSETAGGERRAFLYRKGRMTDLNDFARNAGLVLTEATAIDDAGRIAGSGKSKDDAAPIRAFLLTGAQ